MMCLRLINEAHQHEPETPIILCAPNDDDAREILTPGWVDDGRARSVVACRDTAQLERVLQRLPVGREQ
jgi:hypothetical protein